jgi:hypothetical protein
VRSDGAVLEIDVEVEGLDNAGPTGRCEETQQWRLEPRRSAGAARIDGATPTDASELASNDDALFLLEPGDDDLGVLSRVDPQTLTTTWTVDAPAGAGLVAAAGDAVWLVDGEGLEVTRIGALSGDVEATIPLEDAGVATSSTFPVTTASQRGVWVAIDETQTVYRIDALTNTPTKIGVAGRIDALAPAADGVFASVAAGDGGAARLARFSEVGLEQSSAPVDDLPSAMASDDVRVWPRSTRRLAAYEAQELEPLGAIDEDRLSTGQLSDLVLALAPGAWTPTTRGLEAFGDDLDQELDVPVVGAAATALVAAGDAVFVLDSGYLMRVRRSA